MKKKVHGRKGRKSIGKQRNFRCSDIDYARIAVAAELSGLSISEVVRDGATKFAKELTEKHVEALRSLELTDETMKQVAAEYLAGQAVEPANTDTTTPRKSAKKKRS